MNASGEQQLTNSDQVREFIAAFNRRDIDAIVAFFAEDAVYHSMPLAPLQGRVTIRAAIQGFVTPARQVDWQLLGIAQTEAGTVLTERVDRFLMADTWVALPVMGAFEFRDGQIAAWRDYFDMNQFTSQLPGSSS